MRKSSYDRYMEAAKNHDVLSEGQIMRGLRGLLHNLDRASQGLSTRLYIPKDRCVAAERYNTLLSAFNDAPSRAITPEHTAKGLAWFAKMHKADGSWRDTDLTRCFNRYARACVDNFARFEWCGYERVGQSSWGMLVPVYRVIAKDGQSFDYHAHSWQAGGGVEVY